MYSGLKNKPFLKDLRDLPLSQRHIKLKKPSGKTSPFVIIAMGLLSILATKQAFATMQDDTNITRLEASSPKTPKLLTTDSEAPSSEVMSRIDTSPNPLRLTAPDFGTDENPQPLIIGGNIVTHEQNSIETPSGDTQSGDTQSSPKSSIAPSPANFFNANPNPNPNPRASIYDINFLDSDQSINQIGYSNPTSLVQYASLNQDTLQGAVQESLAEEIRNPTGIPSAPSIKGEAGDTIAQTIRENIGQTADQTLDQSGETLDEALPSDISAPQVSTISASEQSTGASTGTTSTRQETTTEKSDKSGTLPANAVPPYTERLPNAKTDSIVNAPQAASWIIAILALLLFALFLAWLIRRILVNSHAVNEAAENDLFQTTQRDIYSFDEDNSLDETTDEVDENVHQTLNDIDDDEEIETEDVTVKPGFMARLFSGHKDTLDMADEIGLSQSDIDAVKQDDDKIIDVEVEPLPIPDRNDFMENETDFNANNHDEALERAFMAMPQGSKAETNVQEAEAEDPQVEVEDNMDNARQEKPHQEPAYMETLQRLKIEQDQTNASVAQLAEKFVVQSEDTHAKLETMKQEAAQQHNALDKKIETKFINISNNVSTNLARTQRLTEKKLSQVNNMSTEDIELKIKNLDNRFENQSRTIDNNFSKLMQKLDTLSTPAPQLNRLTSDTSDLKKQIATLESLTKQQPQAQAFMSPPADPRENEILKRLETSLNMQQKSMASWREENIQLSKNFTALSSRIDMIEEDLRKQNSALIEVLEKQHEASKRNERMDALGILESAPQIMPTTNSNDAAPHLVTLNDPAPEMADRYSNGHYQDREPVPASDSDRARDRARDRATPAQYDQTHYQASPQAKEKADEDQRDFTPITFSPDSITPPARGPLIEPLSGDDARRRENTQRREEAQQRPASNGPITADRADDNSFTQTHEEKTIRPLTFNFTSDDKGFINR